MKCPREDAQAGMDLDSTGATVSGSMPAGRVLVVDDEASARNALSTLLRSEGYDVTVLSDGREALDRLAILEPEVVVTDLQMPRLDGLSLVQEGQLVAPHAVYLVMTAFGSIDTAIQAIKSGAEDYVTKPLDVDHLLLRLRRALEKARLRKEVAQLRLQLGSRPQGGAILGNHPSVQRLLKVVAQVAPTRATVLIQGESGTGKELVAAALHFSSSRREQPFVRLNCAALHSELLESELFGHERGAFTGAVARRQGRLEQAHMGTLFLDEVGEIPAVVQVKLLRFLQERQLERVGGNETVNVDVRVVAATNRDLQAEVRAGRFREDLYYRLNVVQLVMPPLRARRTDIPLLAYHFLRRSAEANGRGEVVGFTEGALQRLMVQPWPGNVRELENVVERAVVLAEGGQITENELMTAPRVPRSDLDLLVPGISLADVERIVIERTLDAVEGSTSRAAELLGISQRKIQYRLKRWMQPSGELVQEAEQE